MSEQDELLKEIITKELVQGLVAFVMDLDMIMGVETEERDHIETAVIEGLKAGIAKAKQHYEQKRLDRPELREEV